MPTKLIAVRCTCGVMGGPFRTDDDRANAFGIRHLEAYADDTTAPHELSEEDFWP